MPRQFAQEFDPTRGDLIYGRSDVRDEYEASLSDDKRKAIEDGAWVRIDVYNNASVVAGVQNATADKLLNETLRFAREADGEPGPHDVEQYTTAIFNSQRYSPLSALAASQEKLKREHPSNPNTHAEWLAIRRACKFGIEYVVQVKGTGRIHFVLDKISMKDVIQKATFKGSGRSEKVVPITTSELRSIYRNWHRPEFRDGIIFYVDRSEVPAPWVSDKKLWSEYGQHRVKKYRATLEAEFEAYRKKYQSNAPKLNELQRMIKKLDKDLGDLVKAGRYAEAVEKIQEAIRAFAPQAVQQD